MPIGAIFPNQKTFFAAFEAAICLISIAGLQLYLD
jgi:hypothetical protein